MSAISKPFAGWVTSFRSNSFLRARLRLTASYTAGIIGLLLVFNVAVYATFGSNVLDTPEAVQADQNMSSEQKLFEQAQDEKTLNRLKNALYVVDALTILLVAWLSYSLAGRSLRPLEEAFERQKKFVADVAHELRTPLAVLKTGAEATLASRGEPGQFRKFTQDALDEVNHLAAITDDLLFLVGSDAPYATLRKKLDLGRLVALQNETMKRLAFQKKISLKENIQFGLFILGNATQLRRLLTNLIKNAIDYNREGGEVEISLRQENGRAVLEITDTGIGIASEEKAHVFERFYKSDRARSRETGGAGLGLSIVAEIVRSHEGKVDLWSELGRGTRVTAFFTLVRE